MLVISRKVGEKVMIGNDIVIMITGVSNAGGKHPQIRIGIQAPEDVVILRSELADHEQNQPKHP